LELAHAVAAHRLHDGVVDRRLHAQAPPLLADVAVQVVDLGAPAAHHVLQERGPPAAAPLAFGGDVRLDLGEAPSLDRVDEALGDDAVDGLDLVPAGASYPHDLAADVDREAPRPGPGSYIPAPIVMTLPSVRSRPAIAATRSSLIPFWKSTTTPFGFLRYWMPSDVAHSVSYDLTLMKTASKGSVIAWASKICSALTRTVWSPHVTLRRRPACGIRAA